MAWEKSGCRAKDRAVAGVAVMECVLSMECGSGLCFQRDAAVGQLTKRGCGSERNHRAEITAIGAQFRGSKKSAGERPHGLSEAAHATNRHLLLYPFSQGSHGTDEVSGALPAWR